MKFVIAPLVAVVVVALTWFFLPVHAEGHPFNTYRFNQVCVFVSGQTQGYGIAVAPIESVPDCGR